MSRHLIAFIVLFVSSLCKAQVKQGDIIYCIALEKYTQFLDTNGSEIPKGRLLYLEKPNFIDSIPSEVNGYKIVQFTDHNQRKIYKENSNRISHGKILPVVIEDNVAKISIVFAGGRLKGRKYYLTVAGGTFVYFKYNCDEKRFVFDKIESLGI